MLIPIIPTKRSNRHKDGGDGGGRKLKSGKSNSSSGTTLDISDVGGLSDKANGKAATYSEGGEIPIEVEGAHFNGSGDDDVAGDQVDKINHHVGGYSDLNNTQPGGEVLGVITARDADNGALLFFVPNEYNAIKVQSAVRDGVTDTDPFNSTSNLLSGTAAQFFRVCIIAALLRDYDSAGGSSGIQNFVPDPPLPSRPNVSTRACPNYTIVGTPLSTVLPVPQLPY